MNNPFLHKGVKGREQFASALMDMAFTSKFERDMT